MLPRDCEFDVAEELNTVLVTLRKKVDKKTKRSIEELLEEIPSINSNYQSISISPRALVFCVLENVISFSDLFDLFITLQHRQIIVEHINSNVIKIQTEEKKNTENLMFSRL